MPGWIKIKRGLLKHWCASDPNFLAVWVHLLADANFETKKTLINSNVVELDRGQLFFGLNAFSKKSGVSVSKLRRVMKVLENEHMIDRQKTNKYSIITITNYHEHQKDDRQNAGKTQANDIQDATPKERQEVKKVKNKDLFDEKTSIEDGFIEFWKEKPSRGKKSNPKKPALQKYTNARKSGVSHDDIMKGLRSDSFETERARLEFNPMASTWLAQERWDITKDDTPSPGSTSPYQDFPDLD